MGSNHNGYTPVLESIGLTREVVLRATGQDIEKPLEYQQDYARHVAGRYQTLAGNKNATEGGKMRETDIALIYLLRRNGVKSKSLAKLYGVCDEAINKQFRRRGIREVNRMERTSLRQVNGQGVADVWDLAFERCWPIEDCKGEIVIEVEPDVEEY